MEIYVWYDIPTSSSSFSCQFELGVVLVEQGHLQVPKAEIESQIKYQVEI